MDLSDTFLAYFDDIKDPRMRTHRNFRHSLSDIIIITVLAAICGADGWAEIEFFANAKKDWLETFLKLPNGIPSQDTFARVFSLINPEKFEECFLKWINSLDIDLEKEIIAIDGKRVRGSGNKRKNEPALHLVSAWAAKNRVMLAQEKTEDKSNEITAIPKLLNKIDVKKSIVTIDAMGCQKEIANQIRKQGGDYLLALKENQKTLYDNVLSIFARAEENKQKQYKKILHLRKVVKTNGHGRREKRTYTLVSPRDTLPFELRWPGLRGIGKVDIKRTEQGETQRSTRYFLTSLDYKKIDEFIEASRNHWQIEIDLHWSLDVSFHEDHCQIHMKNAAENLAIIRRIALNLLKKEDSAKAGITCKRKGAGWSHAYLLKVLTADRKFLEKT